MSVYRNNHYQNIMNDDSFIMMSPGFLTQLISVLLQISRELVISTVSSTKLNKKVFFCGTNYQMSLINLSCLKTKFL